MERRGPLYLSRSSNVTMPSFDHLLLDLKRADPHEAEVQAPVDGDDCVLEFAELLLSILHSFYFDVRIVRFGSTSCL